MGDAGETPERAIADVRACMAATPAPRHRPGRQADPPNPRVWDYDKVRVPYRHLAIRFLRTLRPGGISAEDCAWVADVLSPSELVLFEAMPNADQRHSVDVAKVALGVTGSMLVGHAALLHDVGKLDCRLGPFGRSVATLLARLFPHMASRWTQRWWREVCVTPGARLLPRTFMDRCASYYLHPWIGHELLEVSGSDPYVSAWALHHHHWWVLEDLEATWDEALALWYADGD